MKIGMIIMMQPQLEAAVDFYQKLGFELKFHMREKWAEFDGGGVKFGLCPIAQGQDNVRTGVVVETQQDLLELYKELKEQGVQFFGEPIVAVHGVMVGVKDPGGNVFDLYQPTPEKVQELARQEQAKQAAEKAEQGEGCDAPTQGCCGGKSDC
jgi:catechol 2,3-dioxygenase-like lactoylglutathione lyase family enzyme